MMNLADKQITTVAQHLIDSGRFKMPVADMPIIVRKVREWITSSEKIQYTPHFKGKGPNILYIAGIRAHDNANGRDLAAFLFDDKPTQESRLETNTDILVSYVLLRLWQNGID